jgi:hypothetical protein
MAKRKRRRRRASAAPEPEVMESAPPTPRATWLAAAALAVFAAAVLVHAPTLHYGLITNWDDPQYVLDDPWIRAWSLANLGHIFAEPYYGNYLPLHLVSYMVDYGLFGLAPFGYHLQSVLWDGVNAVLALLVTRRLFGSLPLAFLAALLFAVHPSHVEVVAWVSARKDLLATAFALLAVWFYDRGGGSRSRGNYLAGVACFALGMLSKASIAVLPLFLIALDRFHPSRQRVDSWKLVIAKQLPYAAIALVLVWVNARAQFLPVENPDPLVYLALKGHAAWRYLALLSGLPRGSPVYDAPELTGGLAIGASLAGLAVLPAALAVAWRRGWNVLGIGAGWVLALLAPAIVFPVLTYMADRYLYAPSLGFCWLLAAGILRIRAAAGSAAARAWAPALLAAIPLALFAWRTLEYEPAWSNAESLWSYALPRSRDYRVRTNLAAVFVAEQRWAEAEALYLEASTVENFVAHHGLALVYAAVERYADARREIEQALEIAARTGADPEYVATLDSTRDEIERLAAGAEAPPAQAR